MRRAAVIGVVAALAVIAGAAARADTTPIQDSPDLPWTNPDHQSSLEVLASKIATTIAKRPVTVRCEGDTDWLKLVTDSGGDPASELGYVAANFGGRNSAAPTISNFSEAAGGKVCLPLKRFAVAKSKPTKCLSIVERLVDTIVNRRVAVKKTVKVNGKRHVKTKFVPRRFRVTTVKTSLGQAVVCYRPTQVVQPVTNAFWQAYGSYALALETLAHEAIHLGGVVGAQLTNGTLLGDAQAEAKAQCYGMQWIPYVAEQLGDSPDDAQAIAAFFWTVIYPQYRSSNYSQYWSADCVPGGAMDLHLPGPAPWT